MGRWTLVAFMALAAMRPLAAAADSPGPSCESAAQMAEAEAGLPSGLLAAIGKVEAGRRLVPGMGTQIWPWTVNARGRGNFLADPTEAISYVTSLLAQNVQSIDVGCFQVNLGYHPEAFRSLSEAFDPVANARYAARFLTALHHDSGDWGNAIARYHSATPEIGIPYRTLVFAAWSGAAPSPMRIAMPRVDDPVVIRMTPEARGIHVYYGAIPMPGSVR